MKKLYSVNEICKKTGLDRKALFDYKDVVPATDHQNFNIEGKEGYKLYDEESLIKLQQIAIFKKLHMKKSIIKDKFNSSEYDSIKILNEQVELLNERKKEIEDLIILANSLKEIGVKNRIINMIFLDDAENYVKNLKKFQDINYFEEMLMPLDFEEYENFINSFFIQVELIMQQHEYDSKDALDLMKDFWTKSTSDYGIFGASVAIMMILSVEGGGETPFDLESELEKEIFDYIGKSLKKYLSTIMKTFLKSIFEVYEKFKIFTNKDFSMNEVAENVAKLKDLLAVYFGIKSKRDFQLFFDIININSNIDETVKYIVDAIKYYENNEEELQ